MSKTFRPWKIDEPLLLPPVVQEFVAKDHLARFVLRLVRDDIDLTEITGDYESERGQPRSMTSLLLYSFCWGIYSSRRIAKASRERIDFMSIVGFDAPDFHNISEFRKRHLKALSASAAWVPEASGAFHKWLFIGISFLRVPQVSATVHFIVWAVARVAPHGKRSQQAQLSVRYEVQQTGQI
jgi:hypothetical protein